MKMNTRKKFLMTILVVLGLLVLAGGIKLLDSMPSNARRNLPKSATDIQEYYHGYFNGDYTRVLKARLPAADYLQYANNLELRNHVKSRETLPREGFYLMPQLKHAGLRWWNPPEEWGDCYYSSTPEGSPFASIVWHDGWVYFYACSL
jgi:hypothetical protein